MVVVSSSRRPSRGDDPDPEFDDFDPELFKRFRDYQEFKKFQEWEHHGGTKGSTRRPGRPLWQRILLSRYVRAPLGCLVVLLVLGLVTYIVLLRFLHVDDDPGVGPDGKQIRGGPNQSNQVLPQSPKDAIRAVYQYTGVNNGKLVCLLLTPDAAKTFAANLGAPTCEQAVAGAAAKVTDAGAYGNPKFPDGSAVVTGDQADVRSCVTTVTGGPRLGLFHLSKQSGGWLIIGHENEPIDCRTG
jgi:hypothetical protein